MLHRLRAQVAYPTNSGLATWSRDQMAVRHGQAVHINPGAANEEAPVNEAIDHGDGTATFVCDLPLMDEAAAIDALATLTAASVFGEALPLSGIEGEDMPSWVEHHLCDHDEAQPTGCTVVTRIESALPSATDEWQAGVTYATDDEVTYDGVLYRCVQGHTSQVGWEPPNVPALWAVV